MESVEDLQRLVVGLLLISVVVECYSYAPEPLTLSLPALAAYEKREKEQGGELPPTQTNNIISQYNSMGKPYVGKHHTKTVAVKCREGAIEIVMKADLFSTGIPVELEDLWLGLNFGTVESCKATEGGENEYKIVAPLDECGISLQVTEAALVYSNVLVYSPPVLANGIVRMDPAAVPIECHYARRYSVSSGPLQPNWQPLTSSQPEQQELVFSLKFMTSDWGSERASGVYFLGDVMKVEASVDGVGRPPMRLFVNTCVASPEPDATSEARYTFVDEQGCLTDTRQTGSTSHFLPRVQDDKLQFQLEAFRFHQKDNPSIYITCYMEAVPIDNIDPVRKACSLINGRWRSADRNDEVCSSCGKVGDRPAGPNKPGNRGNSRRLWKRESNVQTG